MSPPLLARIRRSVARTMDEAFSEAWSAGRLDELSREAEEAVREFVDLPERVQEQQWKAFQTLLARYEAREPIEPDWSARTMGEILDSALELLTTLQKWVRQLEGTGRSVPDTGRVDRDILTLERMREEALRHWSWPPTPEEIAEWDSEDERDSLPLDEAFAEIAGVSKDEWLARVEKRRKELRGDSDHAP
jgi:hypothetical protein